jgi:C4-dicarboxylate-specific signal transduction histidine kinase
MDTTGTRNAEAQLHDARNELARVTRATTLGELSSTIAHEICQPLAAIVIDCETGLRWIKRVSPNISEATACLQRAAANAERAAKIIHRIRLLTTKGATQFERLDIHDVLGDVVSLTQREVESHRVSMRISFAPSLPPMLGDRVQMQQVLVNLVMNGIQSMETISGGHATC